MTDTQIDWPEEYEPAGADLHVVNEILIEGADTESVWTLLIRAAQWPEWYDNSGWIRFLGDSSGPELEEGTRFRWWTFNAPVWSVVKRFEPPNRLAWTGRTVGTDGYHAWRIEDRDGGCYVRTEETQSGIVPTLLGWHLEPSMHDGHQKWLEAIADQVGSGASTPA